MSKILFGFSHFFLPTRLAFDKLWVQKRHFRQKSKPFLVQLLSNDTPKLGKLGDVVSVSRGYYRNVLFLKRRALAVSAVNLKNKTVEETASAKGPESSQLP
ncbi:mitochondrial ribosomal protein subunit L9 [Schizosaccharomyces osmophilus]|uniref:Mitochondrial ribosomal protein subunit L9 n=1 Tax=Schizosaccharomyces osmophilus TaxID=2545709 RepID=A0AAF0AZS1_9SCHI|nr:mitochondrial ribosomal protein subunit L9 [Schizosaccharomyces osmophilus]WBW75318.1 mitochondrial ribosomal protein subunit L9 [Schizosaccharomyces osmophilus]